MGQVGTRHYGRKRDCQGACLNAVSFRYRVDRPRWDTLLYSRVSARLTRSRVSWDSGTWDKSWGGLSRQFSTAGEYPKNLNSVAIVFNNFSTTRESFPQNHYSQMRGTAGQEGLTLLNTTIKCPTKLSHFRDQWDKNGKSYAFRRDPTQLLHDPRPRQSTSFTPEGVTLTFFLGQWDMGQNGDRREGSKLSAISANSPTCS
jgi:hypothetical protein